MIVRSPLYEEAQNHEYLPVQTVKQPWPGVTFTTRSNLSRSLPVSYFLMMSPTLNLHVILCLLVNNFFVANAHACSCCTSLGIKLSTKSLTSLINTRGVKNDERCRK